MPIYEYNCELCGSSFEKIRKFSDAELTVCECGKNGKVTRALSTPAFHLKGSGWYKTDYASSKSSNGKSDSKAESKSDAGESKAAESKPTETKTETKSESKPSSTN